MDVLAEEAKLSDLVGVGANIIGDEISAHYLFLVAFGRSVPLTVDELIAREVVVLVRKPVVGLELRRVGHLHVLQIECLRRL